MSETNPYEAPSSPFAPPQPDRGAAGRRLDQKIAVRLLELRARGHYSGALFLRWQLRNYLIQLAAFGVWLAIIAYGELWPLFWAVLGFGAGMFARDFAWFRASRLAWPFNTRAMDWSEVQRIADGP
jgi:hypothetical protein